MRTTVTLSDAQAEYVDSLRAQDDALDFNAPASGDVLMLPANRRAEARN
jgi:hypothetical protein